MAMYAWMTLRLVACLRCRAYGENNSHAMCKATKPSMNLSNVVQRQQACMAPHLHITCLAGWPPAKPSICPECQWMARMACHPAPCALHPAPSVGEHAANLPLARLLSCMVIVSKALLGRSFFKHLPSHHLQQPAQACVSPTTPSGSIISSIVTLAEPGHESVSGISLTSTTAQPRHAISVCILPGLF